MNGFPGANDDAAADLGDESGGLALRLGGGDHRAPSGEDAVEPAWHDVSGEAAGEADHVNVGGREGLRSQLVRLPRHEADPVGLEQLREPHQLVAPRAAADDPHGEVVEVAQERAGPDQGVEVLGVADVPGVHDDEMPQQPVLARPGVVARHRHDRRGVAPVRDHADALGADALLLQPLLHRLADHDHPVGGAKGRVDEPAQGADDDRVSEPAELDRDLREDVLRDHEQRDPEPGGDDAADRADERRIGHADHQVGARREEPSPQHPEHVGEVVGRAAREARALVGGRAHADDVDSVAALPAVRVVAERHR